MPNSLWRKQMKNSEDENTFPMKTCSNASQMRNGAAFNV